MKKKKAYKCRSCDKSFGLKCGLEKHTKTIHESIKAYKCDSCDKHFSQLSNLEKHVKTVHENVKPFRCDSCRKDFSQLGNLERQFIKKSNLINVSLVTKCLDIRVS